MCRINDNLGPLNYSNLPPLSTKRSFSRVHPEYLRTPAVTVWYNNAVSFNFCLSARPVQCILVCGECKNWDKIVI